MLHFYSVLFKDPAGHPHFLQVEGDYRKYHMNSFFPRTASLWNTLPSVCFPDSYNLDQFKKAVNRFFLSVNLAYNHGNPDRERLIWKF